VTSFRSLVLWIRNSGPSEWIEQSQNSMFLRPSKRSKMRASSLNHNRRQHLKNRRLPTASPPHRLTAAKANNAIPLSIRIYFGGHCQSSRCTGNQGDPLNSQFFATSMFEKYRSSQNYGNGLLLCHFSLLWSKLHKILRKLTFDGWMISNRSSFLSFPCILTFNIRIISKTLLHFKST
jgi:hypothetical protein